MALFDKSVKFFLLLLALCVFTVCNQSINSGQRHTIDAIISFLLPQKKQDLLFIDYQRQKADSLYLLSAYHYRETNKLWQMYHHTKQNRVKHNCARKARKTWETAENMRIKALKLYVHITENQSNMLCECLEKLQKEKKPVCPEINNEKNRNIGQNTIKEGNQTQTQWLSAYRESAKKLNHTIRTIGNKLGWSDASIENEIARCAAPFTFRVKLAHFNPSENYSELADKYMKYKTDITFDIKKEQRKVFIGSFETFDKAAEFCGRLELDNENICIDCGNLYHHKQNMGNGQKNNTIYRVQIFAMHKPISDAQLSNLKKLHHKVIVDNSSGLYKYYLGNFTSHRQAVDFKLTHGLNDAFVVVDRSGD